MSTSPNNGGSRASKDWVGGVLHQYVLSLAALLIVSIPVSLETTEAGFKQMSPIGEDFPNPSDSDENHSFGLEDFWEGDGLASSEVCASYVSMLLWPLLVSL